MNWKISIITILIAGILLFLGYRKRATVLPFISKIIKSQPDLKDKQADFFFKATELFSAYQENEKKANKKYKEKVIMVTGEITELNERSVIIGGEMGGINCALKESTRKNLTSYQKGDVIKVKGICVGMGMFDVSLTKCVMIQ